VMAKGGGSSHRPQVLDHPIGVLKRRKQTSLQTVRIVLANSRIVLTIVGGTH
jgi:hypothetical protein